MSQHDYSVANGSGATVRADLNNALGAAATNNSGATAPATTFAGMWWFDTANNLLKIRTEADDAWVTVASLSGSTWSPYYGGTDILARANTFTAAQTVSLTAGGTALTVESTDAGANEAPDVVLDRSSASPAASDALGRVIFRGRDSGGNATNYATLRPTISDPTNGSEDGSLQIRTMVAGVDDPRVTIGGGVQVGGPTGGDKGSGTINVSGDIYKNNTAFSNPDYVFEHHFTGKIEKFADRDGAAEYAGLPSLDGLRVHVKEHHRLPGITDEPAGMFRRGDVALEKIEQLFLYIFQLEDRIRILEGR